MPLSRHVPALVAYLAITLAYTWPLVTDPGGLAPHDLGDPLLSTWTLWWNTRAVPFTDAWWNGPVFVPAPDALAFSDHRVGLGLVTTPLIVGGVAPLAAHNVAFLLTFVLSAIGAYALVYALTGRRDLAWLGGLVFGFHPFRADHLPHLELLASFWLPVVFLALHRAVDTGRQAWHVALAASLTLTAFTTGYYFFFAGVLIGAWLVWFLPWDLPARRYAWLAVALVAPFVPLAPVLLRYREAHTSLGLSRTITDIETLSADLRGFLTPPDTLWLWSAPASWHTPEGAVFPGVTAVLVVAIALWAGRTRRGDRTITRASRARAACLALAVAALAVALVPRFFGAVAFEVAGVRVSVSQAYKPLSVAAVFLVVWALSSPRVRVAWLERSVLVFYVLATALTWAFALGPTARLAGERVLYKAPYAWLMVLPGFADGFRAPARFVMLGALTLAVAASVSAGRLGARLAPRHRAVLVGVLSAAVLLDGWVWPFPVVARPTALEIPAGVPADAVVMELPLGVFEDAAAMFRATGHGHPVANGLSGYEPPHYGVLRAALAEGRVEVMNGLPTDTPLAIFAARDRMDEDVVASLASATGATSLGATSTHHVVLRAPRGRDGFEPPDESRRIPIARVTAATGVPADAIDDKGLVPETRALDGNPRTAWFTNRPQAGDEHLIVELTSEASVDAVVLAQGPYTTTYARRLVVSVSPDGGAWTEVWRGDGARPALTAALADPREIRVVLSFAPVTARFVRVSQVGRSDEPWAVAELSVLRAP